MMGLTGRIFRVGALISLASMITVVAIQVFSRFFLESSPHWTEEAARIFFIYSVAFGTGAGIRNGDFVKLNLIGRYLSRGPDRMLEIATDIIVAAFSVILVFHSLEFIRLGMDELSPALKVPMGLVFISITLTGLAIFIFTLENLFRLIRGTKHNETNPEGKNPE